ncbi:MAG: ATP-binding protein [Kofleriaceae bacterium]
MDDSARKSVERRLSILVEAGRVLAAPIDYLSTLHAVVAVVVPRLADWAIVYLDQGQGAALAPVEVAPADEPTQEIARAFEPDDSWDHPVARAMRSGAAVALEVGRGALAPAQEAAAAAVGATALATVPLIARGRSLGALMVGGAHGASYDPDDLALLEELARRAGAAIDTAQLFEAERRTNERLTEAVARQQDADRRKDEFLAILGHELRNPLAPIVTALDLMAMQDAIGFERERDVIRRQADHLIRLVDDLLDISRVTREKIQLRKELLELSSIVTHAVEVVSPLFEKRRHRLVVDVPRDGLLVDADAVRLAQVFSNLLANAAKYTEPGGSIAIRAAAEGDAITVAVEDNGNGISKGLLAHIFDPFVQSDRTIDRAQGGLGLGLALVRSLTQLHGGTVTAHSEGPGHGSRFEVRLPAVSAAPAPIVEEITARVVTRRGAAARVLVVDDNADAADMLADVLRGVGYEVAVAHDAPAALHIAARFCPAIALLDIGLPVMDGYELARHLRACLTKPPRLVAVSGYGSETDMARSRAAGFDVHLGKPVSFEMLVQVLGHLPPHA